MANETPEQTTGEAMSEMVDVVVSVPANQVETAMGVMQAMMDSMSQAMSVATTDKAAEDRQMNPEEQQLAAEIDGMTGRL